MASNYLKSSGIDFGAKKKEQGDRLDYLRNRVQRCVCRYCGNKLSLRKITYAAYDEVKIETYCTHCDRLESGVEPEIRQLAEYYVDEIKYDHYPNLDDSVSKRRMNIAAVCDVFSWGYKCAGILKENGFIEGVNFDFNKIQDNLLISDKILKMMEEEGEK